MPPFRRGFQHLHSFPSRDSETDGTNRPDWSTPVFRYTSKISRQVLRLLKHCFHKPASQALYESQLQPMLLAYL